MDHVQPALSHDVSGRGVLKNYWHVAKPGIVFGNLVSLLGGFFLAARGHADPGLLLATATGTCLVIASACVLNNCLDRSMDRLMSRTCRRVLAQGLMSVQTAIVYAAALGGAGMAVLMGAGNMLTVAIVLGGFAVYVGVYSLLKRHSVHAPLVGSLAGAAPPLAGYCAASHQFDGGAVSLLLIFGAWQIPHFYSITVFRLDDYIAADIPVLPVRQGVAATRRHIIGFILAFIAATMLPTFLGYAGYGYLAAAAAAGAVWLCLAWKKPALCGERLWARRLFIWSILAICILSIAMSTDFARTAA